MYCEGTFQVSNIVINSDYINCTLELKQNDNHKCSLDIKTNNAFLEKEGPGMYFLNGMLSDSNEKPNALKNLNIVEIYKL